MYIKLYMMYPKFTIVYGVKLIIPQYYTGGCHAVLDLPVSF